MEIPFIHKFQVGDKFYIYDVNTNNILKVDKNIYNIVDTDERNCNSRIKEMENKGIFSPHKPLKIIQKVTYAKLKEILDADLKMISLFVSDTCNFACRYCYFSSIYILNNSWKNKLMEWEVAKKSLDFYFLHSKNVKRKLISFYGGEPLLNFKIIKNSVEYAKKLLKNKDLDITFSLTTNFYNVTIEQMNFFIENKFNIAVSLDGPKHVHDNGRINLKGNGTFDKIMSNLERIRKLSSYYFERHIGFICVVQPDSDLKEIVEFFSNHFPNNVDIRISGLVFLPMNKNHPLVKSRISQGFKNEEFLYNEYKSYKINGISSISENIFQSFYEEEIKKIHNRFMNKLGDNVYTGGPCIPGELRPLVDIDGTIYACGRMRLFPIGDIYNGINVEKPYNLMVEFTDIQNEICRNCWAIRFCGLCYISAVDENGKISKERLKEMCEREKKAFEGLLKRYVEIMELNPKAFDNLRSDFTGGDR